MKIKVNVARFFSSSRVRMVLSLLAAIIVWFIIAITVENNISRDIVGIPVSIDESASSLANINLQLSSVEETLVSVEVYGPRTVVGGLNKDSLVVKASLSGITGPGVWDLRLTVEKADPNADFQVRSFSPQSVSVSVDRQTTKTFDVKVNLQTPQIPDGFMMEQYSVSPQQVTVIASDENIAKIDHVGVDILPPEGQLESSVILTGTVALYDAQGRELPADNYYVSPQEVEVSIPILKMKTLPLVVDYVGVPPGFDKTSLTPVMSTSELQVAGPADQIDLITELHLGYVDLSELYPGKAIPFDIELPAGFLNIQNINTTLVNFPLDGYTQRTLSVDNITLINQPANFDVDVLTQALDVQLIGPAELLEELTGDGVVAELDLSEHEVTGGQYNLPVTIVIPGQDRMWAVGQYTVVIVVQAK